MTAFVRFCRPCGKPITDEADAVLIASQEVSSGPGWNIWAHPQHRYEAIEMALSGMGVVPLLIAGGSRR